METTVDLIDKTVKWTVNGVLKAINTYKILADKKKIFRPYIEMFNTNDIVEMIM